MRKACVSAYTTAILTCTEYFTWGGSDVFCKSTAQIQPVGEKNNHYETFLFRT